MRTNRILAIAATALILCTQVAAAQDWQKRKRDQQPQAPQQQQQQRASPPAGGACVPSGFGGLSRNCSVNTGGCQRMPEQCNRGWCCP